MSDKSVPRLKEMAIRGSDFRDTYEFELYGEPVIAVLQPLVDDEFLPIAAALADHFDVEDEDIDAEEAVGEAVDRVDEAEGADEDEDSVDISKMDERFVDIMQGAAILGLVGDEGPDGEVDEYTEEEKKEIIESMMGGYSVELGSQVLEISGDVRDAEKFRGARGRVEHTRSE